MSLILRGKVREVHDVGDGRLVMVTSDRISAYDVVMPTEIPGKGQVLTGLSIHWFQRMADLVPNHLLGWRLSEMPDGWRKKELAGRVMLVKALDMLPVECVVRGYLIGSGWRDYQQTGATSGVALPPGLQQADRLPEPIFTPAAKAEVGEHDENITMDDVVATVGPDLAADMERVSIAVYERAVAALGNCSLKIFERHLLEPVLTSSTMRTVSIRLRTHLTGIVAATVDLYDGSVYIEWY